MPDASTLELLQQAEAGQTVLCVGFPGTARGEAGFRELAARVGPAYRFLQVRPLLTAPRQLPGRYEYIDLCIDEIRRHPHRVLAVLGYRIGCAYAAAISERIAHWQREPLLILFDPQQPSAELLSRELKREIDRTMSLLSREEIERTEEIAAMVALRHKPDLVSTAAEMIERYFDIVNVAFERIGLGDIRSSNLNEPFESYISWVSAAPAIDLAGAWKRSTAIVSSDYAHSASQDSGSVIGRRIHFDVARTDLLRSDCAAHAVLDLLSARETDACFD